MARKVGLGAQELVLLLKPQPLYLQPSKLVVFNVRQHLRQCNGSGKVSPIMEKAS